MVEGKRTWRNIVVLLDRDVLCELDIVDGFQDCKPLTDGCNANLLQAVGVQHAENITGYVVL